ncbi:MULTISPECIES: hypothetical protein [unclassified Carboxylicivirga]|uniref:hypothetical protein n=1 Tax=Carboxylicivirga TaxID=1628153 RepID=UPI003D34C0A2
MKQAISFSKSSITIKFGSVPPKHISARLIELGFKTNNNNNKSFVRTKKLAQNEHEY